MESIHSSLESARKEKPFQPFTIVTTGGTRIAVKHPDLIIIGPRLVSVHERQTVAGEQIDTAHTIQVRNISHIETIQDDDAQKAA